MARDYVNFLHFLCVWAMLLLLQFMSLLLCLWTMCFFPFVCCTQGEAIDTTPSAGVLVLVFGAETTAPFIPRPFNVFFFGWKATTRTLGHP